MLEEEKVVTEVIVQVLYRQRRPYLPCSKLAHPLSACFTHLVYICSYKRAQCELKLTYRTPRLPIAYLMPSMYSCRLDSHLGGREGGRH